MLQDAGSENDRNILPDLEHRVPFGLDPVKKVDEGTEIEEEGDASSMKLGFHYENLLC